MVSGRISKDTHTNSPISTSIFPTNTWEPCQKAPRMVRVALGRSAFSWTGNLLVLPSRIPQYTLEDSPRPLGGVSSLPCWDYFQLTRWVIGQLHHMGYVWSQLFSPRRSQRPF